jgi:hypothetical protein
VIQQAGCIDKREIFAKIGKSSMRKSNKQSRESYLPIPSGHFWYLWIKREEQACNKQTGCDFGLN